MSDKVNSNFIFTRKAKLELTDKYKTEVSSYLHKKAIKKNKVKKRKTKKSKKITIEKPKKLVKKNKQEIKNTEKEENLDT